MLNVPLDSSSTRSILFGGILPLLLIGIGLGVFFGMQRPEASKVSPLGTERASLLSQMPEVDVALVRSLIQVSDNLHIPVTGSVVPFREIEIAAEVAGRVVEMNPEVQGGKYIQQGDLLFRIDPRDYQLEVNRLKGRRDQAAASIRELQQEIENARRTLEVAEEDLELAESEVDRFKKLPKGISSGSELDKAKRNRLTAITQRVNSQNQLASLQSQQTRLRLAKELAETELEQAELQLSRTEVRAPVDGVIVSEQIEQESYVQQGAVLVTLEDTSSIEVSTSLRMDQLYWILDRRSASTDQLISAAQGSRHLLPKLPVQVRYEIQGRESQVYRWKGQLDRYEGGGLDPQSRTVPVRVLVDEPGEFTVNGQPASASTGGPNGLVRGMFVDLIIEAPPARPLLLIPKLAIKPSSSSSRVWQFSPDDAAFEDVRRGILARSEPEASRQAKAATLVSDIQSNQADQPRAEIEATESQSNETQLDPNAWCAGFLKERAGLQVIGPFDSQAYPDFYNSVSRADSATALSSAVAGSGGAERFSEYEYVICESKGNALSAGDWVIISPLQDVEKRQLPVRARNDSMQRGLDADFYEQ